MGDSEHRRADWRFLLADRARAHTLVVERAGADDRGWRWLVEDGWTDRLTVIDGLGPDPIVGEAAPADVILVRSGADLSLALDRAAPTASIVVELPRSGRELLRPTTSRLEAAGFTAIRRYLATPDLNDPKRLTPLGERGGLRWLLGPAPITARGRLGRSAARAGRAATIGVAAAAFSTRLATVLGHGLLVAERGDDEIAAARPGGHHGDMVLLTSGHDEGSRVILLPLESGRPEPREVLKISPRPRFNHNVEAEIEVVELLRSTMKSDTRLLPRPLGSLTLAGGLVGAREGYAGRWTASDLGYRQPGTRQRVLGAVLQAATDLAAATGTGSVPWSDSLFDDLIGRPHDRYCELVGRSGQRDQLIEVLAERSRQLLGRPMPMVRRHHDLGPWNVVFGSDGRPTVIDWEVAPPRQLDAVGPAGADHLYFVKYWLHIGLGTGSVADELLAFEFFGSRTANSVGQADAGPPVDDLRYQVSTALAAELDTLGVDCGFVPLLAGHIWLEKALYTIARQASGSPPDPGAAGAYLDALADHRQRLLAHWTPGRR